MVRSAGTRGRWAEVERNVDVMERVRTGSAVEALAVLDRMAVEINERRASLAELANALD